MSDKDMPLIHGHLTIRSPRSVILLNPFQFTLVLALLLLSITFTFWPEALEHSPVSFEERGIVHHVWHYTLLVGAMLTMLGMFSASRRRMQVEVVGIILLIGAVGVNLTAIISYAVTTDAETLSGFDVATRGAFIVGLCLRAGILLFEPTVRLRGNDSGV